MRKPLAVVFILALVGCSSLLGTFEVTDESSKIEDGADTGASSGSGGDTGSTTKDSSVPIDTGSPDAGTGIDTGVDAAPVDAGPDAEPPKDDGKSCLDSSECKNGNCIDKVCCDHRCSGQCEACDVNGSVGTCKPIDKGTSPHGLRTQCAGNSVAPCAGSCDGVGTECSYPGTSVGCGASCDGTCSGAGTCTSTGAACPNGFACGAGGCFTSCTSNSQCQAPFFTCNASNTCERIPEADCLDGVDNNGDQLIDCADPTCTSVECVPDTVPTGQLGNLTSGACDTEYGPAQPEHQNLATAACSDTCGCSTTVTCNSNHVLYGSSDTTCSPFGILYSIGVSGSCTNVGGTYGSSTSQKVSVASQTCTPSGTSTLANPTWGVSTTFCPSKRSSKSCPAVGDVCVQKRAAGSMCMKLPSAASCPPTYSASSGIYYADFEKGSCSCDCAVNTATCTGFAEVLYYNGSNCTGTVKGYNTATGCGTGCCSSTYYFATVNALNTSTIGSILNYSGGGSGTCSGTPTQTGTTGPLGQSLICCR